MRPTIEEIKEGFKKCGLKPMQGSFRRHGGCCGLTAYASYLGLPVTECDTDAIQCGMEDRLGEDFTWGFVNGWDGSDDDERHRNRDAREGYELGRRAWEACKCDG